MKQHNVERLLRAACLLALFALGLMIWSLFDARPIPVIVSMSVGQLLGTVSLGTFLYVVVNDLRARLRSEADEP